MNYIFLILFLLNMGLAIINRSAGNLFVGLINASVATFIFFSAKDAAK